MNVINQHKPQPTLMKKRTFIKSKSYQTKEYADIVVSGKDLQMACRFVEPFLEDVYTDATKKVRLHRTLKRIKKALR